ncbi:TIGR01244 family sulfur transferase [Methylobacterium sp. E-045]|uniref:TIGR01244 family sulfur transferase n=1 Tax=Methylobacterium sp. E-045 TaxID=2836575 RepID=UPI001FBB2143|nr:TIGR01244 family sulfur transferase [Methylobacterium sp. E-045]MCJ2131364.1 TIGR01244 family sulfur transferase [Methylobacterium sp. E-045]
MTITPIDSRLSVSGQPSEAEIADLSTRGFALLINNRPEGEEPGQLGSAAEAAAAEAAGLAYLHLPVTGPGITHEDIARFREAVEGASGPVLAHCRSGTRSLTLWALSEVLAGRLSRDDILAYGRERGFDLGGAVRWLDTHGQAPTET